MIDRSIDRVKSRLGDDELFPARTKTILVLVIVELNISTGII